MRENDRWGGFLGLNSWYTLVRLLYFTGCIGRRLAFYDWVAKPVVHVNSRAYGAEQWHYGMVYGKNRGGVNTRGPLSLTV